MRGNPAHKRNITIIILAVAISSIAVLVARNIMWRNAAVKEFAATSAEYRMGQKIIPGQGTKTGKRSGEKAVWKFTSGYSAGTDEATSRINEAHVKERGGREEEVKLIFGKAQAEHHGPDEGGDYLSNNENDGKTSGPGVSGLHPTSTEP